MSMFALASSVQRLTSFLIPKYCSQIAALHTLSKTNLPMTTMQSHFLEPVRTQISQDRGLKHKRVLHLRCKDCYFETIDGILHVNCKTHGRHKQVKKKKIPRNMYILTSICNSPRRPW